ncbi:GNAT family N-acetyltransferase [Flavobacterium aquidurense]|uniref:N-acetyltransferase GCN5 n=1 Tax=Flavobacterium aquidurense TaxID=362413 RepID=A0A0Q0SDV3_9FLAO|nr:GNAT family protein [Flavobacterium aquidurense]KQB42494.1 N-acetyltransferase GCN5 [Flavobacterium aquidurense]
MITLVKFEKEMYEQLISWVESEEDLMLFAGPKFTFPLTTEQLDASLTNEQRFAFQVINEGNNLPIGHCEIYLTDEIAVLGRILIGDKSYRGQGFGKAIIIALLEHIKLNIDRSKIELNVFDFNSNAIKCYEKVGFRINQDKKSEISFKDKSWTLLNMRIE